jgi:predicted membrane channel-forming protein YqfA (hemolysin III family)
LGSIAASYSAFSAEQQEAVRTTHFRRALFAFFGLLCALASAALAVVAKWLPNEALADAAVIVLFFAFGWGIVSAFLTVREVR